MFLRPLKILLVTHGFPPHQTAGTETYTADLGVALLKARDHDVHVFTAHKDISRPNYSLGERKWNGLVVHEIVNNLFHRDFSETWSNRDVERAFQRVLVRVKPDVVHVQHLLYLSTGCVRLAREAGAAVVFTLHDFWLQCPRFGQRVHPDGGVCDTIDFGRCGTCLAQFKFGQDGLERTVGGVLAGLRSGTGIDLSRFARAAKAKLASAPGAARAEPDPAESARFAEQAAARTLQLRTQIVPAVDLFLSPSRFLRDRFVEEWGIEAGKIEHLRFGVDLEHFAPQARTRSDRLRVAFIGSLVPLKGAHLLLDAWSRVDPALRARGELVVHGPSRHHPEYQELLAELARSSGAKMGGELDRAGVARVLANTDLLVVPSLWFENSPLVILEALASRTPLLVSDLGGMAELVEDGVSGFHFALGDAQDLAAKLTAALSGELDLGRLYARAPDLPRFSAHVAVLEARYRALAARKPA
jgi:glycosyltransferase involved in cell wall biosynthesis